MAFIGAADGIRWRRRASTSTAGVTAPAGAGADGAADASTTGCRDVVADRHRVGADEHPLRVRPPRRFLSRLDVAEDRPRAARRAGSVAEPQPVEQADARAATAPRGHAHRRADARAPHAARRRPPRRAGAGSPVAASSAWLSGVAEVERHPDAARVLLVQSTSRRLARAQRSTSSSSAGPRGHGRGQPARGARLEQRQQRSSPMRPYFTASARAARRSSRRLVGHERRRRGSSPSAGGSRPAGCGRPRAGRSRPCRRSRCRSARGW